MQILMDQATISCSNMLDVRLYLIELVLEVIISSLNGESGDANGPDVMFGEITISLLVEHCLGWTSVRHIFF